MSKKLLLFSAALVLFAGVKGQSAKSEVGRGTVPCSKALTNYSQKSVLRSDVACYFNV